MKMRLTGFQQLWHACMHYWVCCLCSFKFLHPPQNPFLWVHSVGLINEYFPKGFGCCLFSFLYSPSRAEMRVMPTSELPSMLFHHCPASLADFPDSLAHSFGTLWLAGRHSVIPSEINFPSGLCFQNKDTRIQSKWSHCFETNFENISASSQLLRSKSIVSAYFSRVGIYVPKMPSRTGRFLRLRMKGLGLSSPSVRKWCCCLLLLPTWLPAFMQRDGKWVQL